MRVTRSGSATVAAGIVRLKVCRRPGSVNPGSTRRKRLEAANHQPGADQQHQRQRELRRDQDLLRSLLLAAEAGAAAAAGHVVEPGPQVPRHRQQPEGQAGDERDRQREAERDRVDGDLVEPRQLCRSDRDQRAHAGGGEQDAEQAAGE